VSLRPPPKVEKLQVALHTKAKGSPSYRFYALYDKIYRKDVLQHAFHRCLANRGVAGVDGMTFQQIEEYGQEKWLDELAEELRQEAEMVGRLNRKLRGWANDFDLGTVSRGSSVVNHHATNRLRRWLCGKHKIRGQGYSRYPDRYLYHKLGLYQLSRSGRRFPSANV
jgi:hypothetical protein